MKPLATARKASRREVEHLIRQHYLKCWPGVVTLILGLFHRDVPHGVMVFALPPRETIKRYSVAVAWEFARLFVEDTEPKNTESWFIGQAIKFIRKVHPEVELLVTYADPSVGHKGAIYRASNWIADGRTDQKRKTARFDYQVGDKHYSRRSHVPDDVAVERVPRISKRRFVYWLDGSHEQRRQLNSVRKPALV